MAGDLIADAEGYPFAACTECGRNTRGGRSLCFRCKTRIESAQRRAMRREEADSGDALDERSLDDRLAEGFAMINEED